MYLLGGSPMIDAMVLIDEVHSLEIYKLPKNLKGFLDLHNSSYDTIAEFNNGFITHSK